ncbi:hypothetical protein NPIL_85601, partial [Nephila pilipes]
GASVRLRIIMMERRQSGDVRFARILRHGIRWPCGHWIFNSECFLIYAR